MTQAKQTPAEEDIICPVCGYYCLGKGGLGCIDKPWIVSEAERRRKENHNDDLIRLARSVGK